MSEIARRTGCSAVGCQAHAHPGTGAARSQGRGSTWAVSRPGRRGRPRPDAAFDGRLGGTRGAKTVVVLAFARSFVVVAALAAVAGVGASGCCYLEPCQALASKGDG